MLPSPFLDIIGWHPSRVPAIPRRRLWLRHPREEELHHVSRFFSAVPHFPMKDIVMHNRDRPCLARECHLFIITERRLCIDILRLRPDRCRAKFHRRVLRIIKRHRPSCAMMSVVAINRKSAVVQAILVHSLVIAPWRIDVAMPMGMEIVIASEDTCQSTVYSRMVKNLLEFRDSREEIIARIADFLKHRLGLFIDSLVKTRRKIGLDSDVSVHNKTLHRVIVKSIGFIHHTVFLSKVIKLYGFMLSQI